MTELDLLLLVSKILVIDESAVSLDSDLEAMGWDSLSNLSFISEVDERLNRQMNAESLSNAKTVQDLLDILNS